MSAKKSDTKPTETPKEVAPEVTDISNGTVVTKYSYAATAAKNAMNVVIEKTIPGAKLIELCQAGDDAIKEEITKLGKGKKYSKGIAFPTCISVNNVCCHVSPMTSDPEANIEINKGDLVKVELGAHMDGYPALIGHSFVVGATKEEPATGKCADVILAARNAVEAAFRLVRPGNRNYTVTDTVQKICESYGTKPAEGTLSYQIAKDVLEGEKQIIFNPSDSQRKGFKTIEFAENEVYCVAVYVSSGKGKLKETKTRTTVYKRSDSTYGLKMKAAISVKNEIKEFGNFPFTLRSLSDEKVARMGIVECTRSGVTTALDVSAEKEDEVIASFMYTVLVTPTYNNNITRLTFDTDAYKSEKKIESPELLEVLKLNVGKKANKKSAKAE